MRDHGRAVRTRVGRTIRQLRRQRGWSQERLAELANSSAKHVGQIERGQVSAGVDALAEIAAAKNRYEFMIVVGPLPIPNATGSPVNPIAMY